MMKLICRLICLLASFILSTALSHGDERRPNILVILADDLGYGDLGCYGCKDIPTPSLDRIATQGVRFTQGYVYNVCSPTRAALNTGRYAERSGIRTVLMGGSVRDFAKATTLAQCLQRGGYRTGLIGKWHLGYVGDVIPTRMGFHEFFGHLGGKIDYYKHTDSTQKGPGPEGKHDLWEGEEEVFREGYSTELFTDRAIKFVRDHSKGPFFLQLCYNAPHYSTKKGVFQSPESYLKKFGVASSPNGTRGGYAAMVNCMDDQIGRLLDELAALKIENDTLVIFASDNGSELVGSNGDLSGAKKSSREGGIRVPFIARMPGRIPAGSVRHHPVHIMDVLPTVLSLTGTTAPEGVKLDGVNIWPAMIGKEEVPERSLFFPPSTLRRGDWKLSGDSLYNLSEDPAERKDVARKHKEIAERLNRELEVFRADLGIRKKAKAK
jgi:arylsulfatase A-like enzyme